MINGIGIGIPFQRAVITSGWGSLYYTLTSGLTKYRRETNTAGGYFILWYSSDGGGTLTNRGVCWSTSANPTTSDSKTVYTASVNSFTDVLRGLHGGVTYHVRAYATNESGTSYGSDVEFTTLDYSPAQYRGKTLMYNGKILIAK